MANKKMGSAAAHLFVSLKLYGNYLSADIVPGVILKERR
jgi:hypothetical protein